MPIISVEIIKIIDKRETHKKKDKKEQRSDANYSKRVRTKWAYCAFKVSFLQLICKTSLIFKSNLELTLTIILKERESYNLKHVALECGCLKMWHLICSTILVLKRRQVSPI